MRKRFILVAIACLSAMAASAKSVVFTMKDGSLVYYLLGGETNPVMKFVEGKVVVNADTYELLDIKNFYVSATDDPNGIEHILQENKTKWNGQTFVVKGKAESVQVFSIGGTQMKEARVSASDEFVNINLTKLPDGVYIIKVGESSFKVKK